MASSSESSQPDPRVRVVSEPTDVPVFNCVVYIAPPDSSGTVFARSATLENVTGRGSSQREALQDIVAAFKKTVAELLADGREIPWLDPPLPPRDDEQQRLIAVHL